MHLKPALFLQRHSQQNVETMLVLWWFIAYDVGPVLNQHWFNVWASHCWPAPMVHSVRLWLETQEVK